MTCKECKIVCDGKEVATIDCNKDGLHIKYTEEGKDLCNKHTGNGCCH